MNDSEQKTGRCPIRHKTVVGVIDEENFREIMEAAPDAMIVVNEEGAIVIVNSQVEALFGFSKEELIGKTIEVLLPERLRVSHVHHRQGYTSNPKLRAMGLGLELSGQRKDGSEFPVEISLSPILTKAGPAIVSAIRDTTERREIEARLRASVREKEALLKEVHHRVKNNLQVISSLLNFQGDLITDPATRGIFQDTRARIKSIALIHERLYQSADLNHINFADYVKGLMDDLFDSFGISRQRIQLDIDIDPVTLDVDTLVNCGLIVNELASNALKYAFPGQRVGTISISLKKDHQAGIALSVCDTGVGLSEASTIFERPSLGLKLVRGLAKELGGKVEVVAGSGANFKVTFPSLRVG